MPEFKAVLYTVTIGIAFFFGFWEWRMRRQLTDEALDQQNENVSDYSDVLYDIRKETRRERILKSLPPASLFKFRVVASLKFLFVAILVIEVIFLQR